MADLDERHSEVARLRRELERNREQALLASEAVRQSERALAELARVRRPQRDKDEARLRAAWRELVAAHGSGRAGWIVRRCLPLNPNEKPLASDPADVHLIVTSAGPLPSVVAAFWEAAWKGEGDAAAQGAAYTAL